MWAQVLASDLFLISSGFLICSGPTWDFTGGKTP